MYSFVKNRKYAYIVAIALTLFSLLAPFILPFRQGIDLTGGIQAEYTVKTGNVDQVLEETKNHILQTAKNTLNPEQKAVISDTMAYKISGTNIIVVEA